MREVRAATNVGRYGGCWWLAAGSACSSLPSPSPLLHTEREATRPCPNPMHHALAPSIDHLTAFPIPLPPIDCDCAHRCFNLALPCVPVAAMTCPLLELVLASADFKARDTCMPLIQTGISRVPSLILDARRPRIGQKQAHARMYIRGLQVMTAAGSISRERAICML